MNFTGTIWRPPYEAWSALLQVTAGCTHHKCKFCTLYEDIPFKFKSSSIEEIEADLKELQCFAPDATRLFLTGANPFVLKNEKLKQMAEQYGKKEEELNKNEGFTNYIKESLKNEKVVEFIVENAKIK